MKHQQELVKIHVNWIRYFQNGNLQGEGNHAYQDPVKKANHLDMVALKELQDSLAHMTHGKSFRHAWSPKFQIPFPVQFPSAASFNF